MPATSTTVAATSDAVEATLRAAGRSAAARRRGAVADGGPGGGASCSSCGDGSHGREEVPRAGSDTSVIVAPCAARSQRRGRRSESSCGAARPLGSRGDDRPRVRLDELNPAARPLGQPRACTSLGAAIDVWARWDSDWYLRIAESRLRLAVEHPAFFPLYPLLVGGLGRVARRPLPRSPGLVVSLAPAPSRSRSSTGSSRRGSDERRTPLGPLSRPVPDVALSRRRVRRVPLPRAGRRHVRARRARAPRLGAVVTGLALLTRAQGVALLPALALFAWRSGGRGTSGLLAIPLVMFAVFPIALEALGRSRSRVRRRAGRVGTLARAVRAARRPRAGNRRRRRRRPGAGDRDGRTRRPRLARSSGPPTASTRSAHSPCPWPSVRAARRPLLVPAVRARRLSVPRGARGPGPRSTRASRSRRGSRRRARRQRGSMGAVVLGRVTEVPRAAARSAGRSSSGSSRCCRTPRTSPRTAIRRDDVLYRWSTAIGGLIQYAIILAVVLLIARGIAPATLGLVRPRSWRNALGKTVIALVAIWIIGAVLNIFLKAGEEQGPRAPRLGGPNRAAAFAANFVVVAVVAPIVEELTYRGLGFAAVRDAFGVGAAVVVTALAFGLAHGLVVALPVLTIFGAILAWSASRPTASTRRSALHALFNGAGAHRRGDGVSDRPRVDRGAAVTDRRRTTARSSRRSTSGFGSSASCGDSRRSRARSGSTSIASSASGRSSMRRTTGRSPPKGWSAS